MFFLLLCRHFLPFPRVPFGCLRRGAVLGALCLPFGGGLVRLVWYCYPHHLSPRVSGLCGACVPVWVRFYCFTLAPWFLSPWFRPVLVAAAAVFCFEIWCKITAFFYRRNLFASRWGMWHRKISIYGGIGSHRIYQPPESAFYAHVEWHPLFISTLLIRLKFFEKYKFGNCSYSEFWLLHYFFSVYMC